MDKLQLKHIAPYLPYALKMSINEESSPGKWIYPVDILGYEIISHGNITFKVFDNGIKFSFFVNFENLKPVLRPMSDLLEDIFCEQFFEDNSELLGDEHTPLAQAIFFLQQSNPLDVCFPYGIWELFFRHHFDVFGLINAGFAIDLNSLQ